MLRGDGWKFVEDGLGASHRTKGKIVLEKVLMFKKSYLGNGWNVSLVRLRRVHPLLWRTVMAVLDIPKY